jgi:hypothetical protein
VLCYNHIEGTTKKEENMTEKIEIKTGFPIYNEDYSQIVGRIPYTAVVEIGDDWNEYGPDADVATLTLDETGEVFYRAGEEWGLAGLQERINRITENSGLSADLTLKGNVDEAIEIYLKREHKK